MTTPLQLYIGDDWAIPFALKDASNNPIDLTGSTVGAVFWAANQQNPVLTLALGSGVAMPTPSNGQFTVTIPRATTQTVPASPPSNGALPVNPFYGTRVQAYIIDGSSLKTTRAIVPIQALDPRTA